MTKSNSGWFKVLFIIMAVVYILGGIVCFMNPFSSSIILTSFIGWMAFFYGIIMIVSYFMSAHFKSIWSLVMGIVLVVLGLVIVNNLFSASTMIGIFAGVCFLAAGAYKCVQSFQLKDFGLSSWWVVLVSGICSIIIGCLMVFNPAVSGQLLAIYVGAGFIASGVSDLVLAFTVL